MERARPDNQHTDIFHAKYEMGKEPGADYNLKPSSRILCFSCFPT